MARSTQVTVYLCENTACEKPILLVSPESGQVTPLAVQLPITSDAKRMECTVCRTVSSIDFISLELHRNPPAPGVFWFCTNLDCEDGKRNPLFSGG